MSDGRDWADRVRARQYQLPPSFENRVEYSALRYWVGSPPFAERVAETILDSSLAPALDTLWCLGQLDVLALVRAVGDRLCDADAARARGRPHIDDIYARSVVDTIDAFARGLST